MVKYHTAMRDIKKIHFNPMNYHKSADLYLRNKGLLRILEIGAGSGNYKLSILDRFCLTDSIKMSTNCQQVPILNFSPQIPN